jgi:hypothetical protein
VNAAIVVTWRCRGRPASPLGRSRRIPGSAGDCFEVVVATPLGLLGFGAAGPSLALFRPTAGVWVASAVVVSLAAAALVVLA